MKSAPSEPKSGSNTSTSNTTYKKRPPRTAFKKLMDLRLQNIHKPHSNMGSPKRTFYDPKYLPPRKVVFATSLPYHYSRPIKYQPNKTPTSHPPPYLQRAYPHQITPPHQSIHRTQSQIHKGKKIHTEDDTESPAT